MTVTHFIPLIGPFELGARKLKTEGTDLQTKYLYSFDCMEPNESHLVHNCPELKINYLSEVDFISNDTSVQAYRELFRRDGVEPTDFVFGVPPCAGLSMANMSVNSGPLAPQNRFIYEVVKFWVAQGSKCLLIENAPTLSSDRGRPVMKRIKEILDANIPGQYAIHLMKTTTLMHGLPQDRVRTFMYIYRTTSVTHQLVRSFNRSYLPFAEFIKSLKVDPKKHSLCKELIFSQETNDSWWHLINNYPDLFKEAARSCEGKNCIVLWPTYHKAFSDGMLRDIDDHPRLKRFFEHLTYKASIGKPGFYDVICPYIVSDHTGAIMHKNSSRIVHPTAQRYLWMREVMCLMGYPVEFDLKGDPAKVFNHVCQSVPINTAADAIRWGIDLINETNTIKWGSSQRVLLQKGLPDRQSHEVFHLEEMPASDSENLLF